MNVYYVYYVCVFSFSVYKQSFFTVWYINLHLCRQLNCNCFKLDTGQRLVHPPLPLKKSFGLKWKSLVSCSDTCKSATDWRALSSTSATGTCTEHSATTTTTASSLLFQFSFLLLGFGWSFLSVLAVASLTTHLISAPIQDTAE